MFFQPSPLCNLPNEILEHIAFELLEQDPTSSTTLIVPLLQTCSHIKDILSFHNNSHLYSRLFRSAFDDNASARRLGARTHDTPHLAHQLTSYSSALACIRCGDIYDEGVISAFWACFALLTENDGKNRPHLEAAGLPDFVDKFVRKRLYEDASSTNGWPQESPINCLALWLLWYTSTDERLKAETPARRSEIIRLILPYVIVPFRYPSAYAPHNHFRMPLADNFDPHLHTSILAAHGPFPIYRTNRTLSIPFYNRYNFEISIPLASTAAKLIFFSRRQVTSIGVPIHLPLNRDHAIQLGFADQIGPTQEDVHELNQHKIVNLISPTQDSTTVPPSSMHDDDWYRLTDCTDPMQTSPLKNTHYTYGSATGLWQGRILVPSDHTFLTILQDVHMREDFTEQQLYLNAAPLYMRLREYHCINPREPVPTGGANRFDNGISNAWISSGVKICENRHAGTLEFNHNGRIHTYEAYRPGCVNSHDEATCHGCRYRGTDEIIYREDDKRYLPGRSDNGGDDADADTIMEEEREDEDEDEQFLADAVSQYGPLLDGILHQRGDAPMLMDEDSDIATDDADVATDDDRDEEYCVQRKCDGVRDIALVGETDYKHGQAWNRYRFYGRVREWDGLIALVRIPVQPHPPGLGAWVFSGYIVGGQNFVGTWRSLGNMDPRFPTLESAFGMTRRDEGENGVRS
ncbi:hypothetical protein M405DRAFT_819370 [Rhizopogon salebrosus TDB-379]|nr:hypothetical protein M405DRAFT_819370 [Rhizopogon salebrosus TDB-379]